MEENDQFNFVHTRYNHISKGAHIYFTNISHPVPSSLLTAPATYANFLFLEHPCSLPLQSLFGLLVSSSYIFRPWLFVWSTLFHLSSLIQHFTSQRGHPLPFNANSPPQPCYSLSKTASLFL